MYSAIDTTALKRPGDFSLSDVILTSIKVKELIQILKKYLLPHL